MLLPDEHSMTVFPLYVLVLIVLINRYFAGMFLKRVRGANFDETRDDYEPTVTVVTPMYNEGKGIYDTICSLLEQDYPAEKLNIMVIDDCSKDDSYTWAMRAQARFPGRVTVLRNRVNVGKRRSINRAVRRAESEIIVSVDSDVVVDRRAVRELVRRFTTPKTAAVGGRVNVINPHENWLTRMQAIKYHFGYVYLKSLERAFRSVMCLSGCLTAYRRDVLLELEPILETRNLFGVPIKYGEDRFLTRQIVKAGYETVCTLEAQCWTTAPPTLTKYFAQQLRWRRSNFVDFIMGSTHAWRLNPFVAVHYYSLFAIQLVYPFIVVQHLIDYSFFSIAVVHLSVLALLGTVYFLESRDIAPAERVHPLWFLSMGVVMPVTYVVHNVVALLTLDAASWETRGHVAAADELEELEAAPQSEPALGL
jgi:cellulose synthase/poly-beta-1,6-N-acetylglucosamine synthase-like glycosyltransferase